MDVVGSSKLSSSSQSGKKKAGRTSTSPIVSGGSLIKGLLLLALGFYAGLFVGSNIDTSSSSLQDCWTEDDPRLQARMEEKANKIAQTRFNSLSRSYLDHQQQLQQGGSEEIPRFDTASVGRFATGLATVSRDEFANRFDMGVPLDPSSRGNNQVLLLYGQNSALPSNAFEKQQSSSSGKVPFIESVEEATENCAHLHVVLTDTSRSNQCIAVMGQYESFHIQKFMRLPNNGKAEKLDKNAPLRLVNRGAQDSGRLSTKPPKTSESLEFWKTLQKYLETLPGMLERLRPIAEKIARDNTIIVMTCNHGQSELLINFVCAAKSRNLDVSSVLLFATDMETKVLAEGLGLSTFYDEEIFGGMPKKAARAVSKELPFLHAISYLSISMYASVLTFLFVLVHQYADRNFQAMMMAKVYCVQLTSMLGYDILFQDVDLVWFKDPLTWFHTPELSKDFDIYFQDDGNHALFYAPYSANTGFYYVRSNERTQYFFNALLLSGDLITSTHSHQIALIAVLNEHASMYGLRVKILERNGEDFPGGFSFHRKKEFMKDIIQGRTKPYIFHMSWTHNKDNKKLFFRQFGEWYVQDKCIGSTVGEIMPGHKDGDTTPSILSSCCSVEALVSCHYRDKPSKIPCKESPPIDKGKPSFW